MVNEFINLKELSKLLRDTFNVRPDRLDSDKEIHIKIGQQEVIEFIERMTEEE